MYNGIITVCVRRITVECVYANDDACERWKEEEEGMMATNDR